jgi:hypothetical protein
MSLRGHTWGLIEEVGWEVPVRIFELDKSCAIDCGRSAVHQLDLESWPSEGKVWLIWLQLIKNSTTILIKSFVPPATPIAIHQTFVR